MDHEREIPIWFFIGALLTVYGVLILGTGLYHLISPPPETLVLARLHADIWWPLVLLAIGLFYTIRHWPFQAAKRREESLKDRRPPQGALDTPGR